jgi:hypothetical protein
MSKMSVIDENGLFKVEPGTLKTVDEAHPVWKARIALALPKGQWLFAPTKGHDLVTYQTVKESATKVEEFQKSVRLYLAPYGPEVVSRFTARGSLTLQLKITKETLNG